MSSESTIVIVVLAISAVVLLFALVFVFALLKGARDVRTGKNVEKAARRMKDPVSGTLLITGISAPSYEATFATADIAGVVSGEGIEPRAIRRTGLVATSKWPKPGQTLPVVVDRADANRFVVVWNEVKTGGEAALDEAERLAAAMRSGTEERPA